MLVNYDVGLLAHLEDALLSSLLVFKNALNEQIVEVLQTSEAPKSLTALRKLVIGVKGIE